MKHRTMIAAVVGVIIACGCDETMESAGNVPSFTVVGLPATVPQGTPVDVEVTAEALSRDPDEMSVHSVSLSVDYSYPVPATSTEGDAFRRFARFRIPTTDLRLGLHFVYAMARCSSTYISRRYDFNATEDERFQLIITSPQPQAAPQTKSEPPPEEEEDDDTPVNPIPPKVPGKK